MDEERQKVGRGAAKDSEKSSRAARTKWVVVVGTIIVTVNLIIYALLYNRSGSQSLLINGVGLVLGLVSLGVAFWQVNRGELDSAAYWVFLALVVAYGFGELVWQGETLSNTIGGVLLIMIVGGLTLPRKWRIWLAVAGIYGLGILLINLFEPLPRQNALEDPLLTYFDIGTMVSLLGLALWQLIRVIVRGKIRSRLLVSFVLLVLLPAIAISAVSAVVGFNNGQRQAFAVLESVADFKEGEVGDWADSLELGLISALTEQDTPMFVQAVLRPGVEFSDRTVYTTLEGYFTRYLSRTGRFDVLFLLDLEGNVVVSTDAIPRHVVHNDQRYFTEGLQGPFTLAMAENPFSEQPLVVASYPAVNDTGQVLGVLVGYVDTDKLDEIALRKSGLGTTGEVYLVGAGGALLATSAAGEQGVRLQTEGVDLALSQTDGEGLYANYAGKNVLGVYRWLPRLGMALLVEEERSEVFTSIYQTLVLNLGMAVVLVFLAVIASLLTARSIADPLANLAETASQVTAGNLGQVVEVEREDEIGTLAQAFNDMTAQVRDLVSGLEERVAARTLELERRSIYLEASAEVARAASSILNVEQLVQQVVELVRQRFSLYYVGLFLVDEIGEWAVLQAGTGEAGQAMLARGHRIRVGEGMIGWCVANAQPRIALDIGEDAVRLATSELPETRSEAALPLRVRGRVIGALTVQSSLPAAFDEETLSVFQTLADQVAIALENARLLAESRAALEAAGRAYGELSREAWTSLLRAQPDVGYRSGEQGLARVEGTWESEMERALQEETVMQSDGDDGKAALAIPIRVRGQVIGVLGTSRPIEAGEWTNEELTLLEALTGQLGEALESARLYRDTQRRAAQEQVMGHIVDRMRRAVDMDALMQTTIQEVASTLGATSAFVQLGVGATAGNGDEDGEIDAQEEQVG
jgi:GAF domain-containing protein/HAMP domain-containing protein